MRASERLFGVLMLLFLLGTAAPVFWEYVVSGGSMAPSEALFGDVVSALLFFGAAAWLFAGLLLFFRSRPSGLLSGASLVCLLWAYIASTGTHGGSDCGPTSLGIMLFAICFAVGLVTHVLNILHSFAARSRA